MPFKSKAQLRWMAAAEKEGKIPKGTFRRWLRHTKSIKDLPEKAEKSSAQSDVNSTKDLQHEETLALLTGLLQHHIDDAEIYNAKKEPQNVQDSLDDSEFILQQIIQKILSHQNQKALDEVRQQDEKREEAAGVKDNDQPLAKESVDQFYELLQQSSDAAFEEGIKYACAQHGLNSTEIKQFLELSKYIAYAL